MEYYEVSLVFVWMAPGRARENMLGEIFHVSATRAPIADWPHKVLLKHARRRATRILIRYIAARLVAPPGPSNFRVFHLKRMRRRNLLTTVSYNENQAKFRGALGTFISKEGTPCVRTKKRPEWTQSINSQVEEEGNEQQNHQSQASKIKVSQEKNPTLDRFSRQAILN